jgi:hypothetical protein
MSMPSDGVPAGMGRPRRVAGWVVRVAALVSVLVAMVLATPDPAAAATDDAQLLADRNAPYVVVRDHPTTCGDGEPYLPVPVTAVLGRRDLVLRGPDGQVVAEAPTAADLAGKGDRCLGLLGAALAPVVGAVLPLATSLGFTPANLVSAVLLCVLVPVAVIGLTLQYGDLRSRTP